MLGEYYYIDVLRKRLRIQQDWIRAMHIYKQCINIHKKVEAEMIKEKPIIYLLNFFYFFPIKILKFFTNLRNDYIYYKVLKEIEVIQREIKSLNKN